MICGLLKMRVAAPGVGKKCTLVFIINIAYNLSAYQKVTYLENIIHHGMLPYTVHAVVHIVPIN
jgi:hypothetical protein